MFISKNTQSGKTQQITISSSVKRSNLTPLKFGCQIWPHTHIICIHTHIQRYIHTHTYMYILLLINSKKWHMHKFCNCSKKQCFGLPDLWNRHRSWYNPRWCCHFLHKRLESLSGLVSVSHDRWQPVTKVPLTVNFVSHVLVMETVQVFSSTIKQQLLHPDQTLLS